MKNTVIKRNYLITWILTLCVLVGCANQENTAERKETAASAVKITMSSFGTTPDGETVDKYIMKNDSGMEIHVITYGGIITYWTAPDKEGNYSNIVLAYDNLNQYIESNPYFGALIGRYGNRIAEGQFTINGEQYQLETNDGPNHLHGGFNGFDKVLWSAKQENTAEGPVLKLTYVSEDGEAGYPGTVTSTVTYQLRDDNSLELTYEATTDKSTIVNLTQHSYFNLSGDFTQDILDHELMIEADYYLPVDPELIPTGEIRPVANTPFDFTQAKAIGEDISQDNEQLSRGKGYDHCWVLKDQGSFRKIASAYHPPSGRFLEISSNEPGLQFYSGNFLDGTLPIPGGGTYGFRSGLCLETQHYPDSPNQETFPSVLLQPGERYTSKTTFKFSTK